MKGSRRDKRDEWIVSRRHSRVQLEMYRVPVETFFRMHPDTLQREQQITRGEVLGALAR
jgi:hypothetical protein